jgi:hypothetical protein
MCGVGIRVKIMYLMAEIGLWNCGGKSIGRWPLTRTSGDEAFL